ncbi:nitrous oxide reductase family maturation protein NosD [Bacillus sp. FJAT-49705]|uniref:Nitrous oxide reductase family maturation protein NosD n=1 Tax=Cytobacillus citreus TaxID=2833586 RepID=A0ABS5NXT1_9BACI|nr:nitrous oxide reductase family maturation protein NosD [Cytobacillus citreus]MBS4192173.1 nitrous oxide reductase family maturation protein NosD [Cytobacillus citreus]
MGKVINDGLLLFYGCIFFLFIPWNTDAAAAEVTVESDMNLQEMIDHAEPGDTLNIQEGLYRGSITISKPITLVAQNGAIIDGRGNGNVITIASDGVVIKGFTIQNSGKDKDNSGILLKEVKDVVIDSNHISNVLFGIYSEKSSNNIIKNNDIESFDTHFSKRGNGIHLYYGHGNFIGNNRIKNVQDGIYFDSNSKSNIQNNTVEDSRYGFHFMFSEDISAEENDIQKNVTGFMIMDSKNLQFNRNQITDQFHFRGFGILIYDSSNIVIEENEIRQNSSGLYFENAEQTHIRQNLIAANQVGIEFKGDNIDNVLTENNFIGNVVQSKIADKDILLNGQQKGNYWDDYSSYDLTGDGIGEIPYKAGSIYDQILKSHPYWQFYFESPAIKIWSKAESMFPSIGTANVYDEKPLTLPVHFEKEKKNQKEKSKLSLLIYGLILTSSSVFILLKGKRME